MPQNEIESFGNTIFWHRKIHCIKLSGTSEKRKKKEKKTNKRHPNKIQLIDGRNFVKEENHKRRNIATEDFRFFSFSKLKSISKVILIMHMSYTSQQFMSMDFI